VVICRGEVVLRNPTTSRLPTASASQRDRPDASARCRRPRSGPRASRPPCTGIGRARRPGDRIERPGGQAAPARRSRTISASTGISVRPGISRVRPGAEVRRSGDDRSRRPEAHCARKPTPSRSPTAPACPRVRSSSRPAPIIGDPARQPVAVRKCRRVLRRHLHRGAVCRGEEVIVVGGAIQRVRPPCSGSDRQAVHMLVRGDGLAESMSVISFSASKGIRRSHCEPRPKSWPSRARTSRAGAMADNRKGAPRLMRSGTCSHDGAVPTTEWLRGCVALDAKGFIKTGRVCRPKISRRAMPSPGRPPPRNQPARRLRVGDVREATSNASLRRWEKVDCRSVRPSGTARVEGRSCRRALCAHRRDHDRRHPKRRSARSA